MCVVVVVLVPFPQPYNFYNKRIITHHNTDNYSYYKHIFWDKYFSRRLKISYNKAKSNKITEYKDLGPISILPDLSKLIEKVVCEQLGKYLHVNKILPKQQSGFRNIHGTATALTKVTNDFIAAVDEGKGSVIVLLDFSMAFDCVNPSLLLENMAYYVVAQLAQKWFHSFLTGKQQFVEMQLEQREMATPQIRLIKTGTPQGSILSPLVFILYTADLVTKLEDCNVHLYADNTQVYHSFKRQEMSEAVIKINNDLNNNRLVP